MAINKVEYGNETLIDLTSDTVTKETLIKGETAHTASGEKIYGEFDPDVYLKKSGGDAKDVVSTFSSSDTDDSVSEWTSVSVLSSGEKLSSLFNKISTMFRNIRYLYKLIGSTDISELSEDGTITKSLTTLNGKLGENTITKISITDESYSSGVLVVTDKIPQGMHAFGFIITGGTPAAHTAQVWENLVNGSINVTFKLWSNNAVSTEGTVSGILLCL